MKIPITKKDRSRVVYGLLNSDVNELIDIQETINHLIKNPDYANSVLVQLSIKEL